MQRQSLEISLFHGEALFRANQKATHFFLITSGRIFILDEPGTSALKQFQEGELFGIPEVLARGSWANTAIANGNTRLTRFEASNLFQSLDEMPKDQETFIRHIASLA